MLKMRKWHRVSGLIAAVFILNLSITGLLLNHPNWLSFGSSDSRFPHKITHTLSHPSSPSTLWIGTKKGLYVSRDSGKTTSKVPLRHPDFPVTDIFIDPESPSHIYVTFKNHLLVQSKNNGRTWSRISTPDSLEMLYSISKDSEGLLVTSDDGIFRLNGESVEEVLRSGSSSKLYHTLRALHTGYIFAPALIWLHDFSALIMVFLTLSGVVIYLRQKRR